MKPGRHTIPRGPAEFTCNRGHTWYGHCRRSQLGYPVLEGSAPCPVCSRFPNSVKAHIGPARADAREKAAS